MGTGPESRSGLDSSFRNRLSLCSENIAFAAYTHSFFRWGAFEKLPEELGRLTYVNRRPQWSIVLNRGIPCLVTQCLSGEENGLDARIT